MKCCKCGVNISNVDKYCPRCGTIFDNGDVERISDTVENQLLNIYRNKMWSGSNISLGYLIFSFWYAIYKRMYIEAVIGALADTIIFFLLIRFKELVLASMGFHFLLVIFLILIGIVMKVYYILHFDELYMIKAKDTVMSFTRDYGTDNVELLTKLCKKDSKGNIGVFVLFLILILGLLYYFGLINIDFLSICGII